jgi:hypothetical protein
MTTYSQPGIFNALDATFAGGMQAGTGASPLQNASALQAAIDAAQASSNPNGAIVLIPSYSVDPTGNNVYGDYLIQCPDGQSSAIKIPNIGLRTPPILICGTGVDTALTMQTAGAVLFDVEADSVTFQDLTVGFGAANRLGTAFSFSGAPESGPQSCGLFRVSVVNCQYPVLFSGTRHARMLECYVNYGSGTLPASTAVTITGGADDTVVAQSIVTWFAGQQVEGNVGVLIDGASNTKLSDTQIVGFGSGIQIQGTSGKTAGVHCSGSNVEAYRSCVVINPSVFDLCFLDCHFQASSNTTGTTLAGIAIGMDGGLNADVDTMRLISCSLTSNSGMGVNDTYGLQIGAAQNIQVHGGHYSGNGATGGIAIVGGATEVQIVGANCIGLEYEGAPDSTPLYQRYGILITNGSDIQIVGVNCSGNGQPSGPSSSAFPGDGIHVDGTSATVSNVRIIGALCTGPVFGNGDIAQQTGIFINDAQGVLVKDCALSGSTAGSGYGLYLGNVSDVTVKACDLYSNAIGMRIDLGSTRVYVRDCNAIGYAGSTSAISIASSLANIAVTNTAGYNDQTTPLSSTPPAGVFNGVTFGYYGPTVFYVTHCNVTLDSQATGLSSGGYTLAPGETAQITAAIGATFLMLGN